MEVLPSCYRERYHRSVLVSTPASHLSMPSIVDGVETLRCRCRLFRAVPMNAFPQSTLLLRPALLREVLPQRVREEEVPGQNPHPDREVRRESGFAPEPEPTHA